MYNVLVSCYGRCFLLCCADAVTLSLHPTQLQQLVLGPLTNLTKIVGKAVKALPNLVTPNKVKRTIYNKYHNMLEYILQYNLRNYLVIRCACSWTVYTHIWLCMQLIVFHPMLFIKMLLLDIIIKITDNSEQVVQILQ